MLDVLENFYYSGRGSPRILMENLFLLHMRLSFGHVNIVWVVTFDTTWPNNYPSTLLKIGLLCYCEILRLQIWSVIVFLIWISRFHYLLDKARAILQPEYCWLASCPPPLPIVFSITDSPDTARLIQHSPILENIVYTLTGVQPSQTSRIYLART